MTADPEDAAASDRGEALRQAIRLSLLDGTSTNPWSDVGLRDLAFRSRRQADAARLEAAIVLRFEGLEQERRARLVSVSSRPVGSTWAVLVEYEDLEQGQRRSLEVSGG